MKISIKTFTVASVTACALFSAVSQGTAQITVNVDPTAPWIGFMNVFNTPAGGGGYVFGSNWGTSDLQATFSGNTLTLAPCVNVWNPTDAFWVNPDGSPNKTMD